MGNPTTKIKCEHVNTLRELLKEFRRQHDMLVGYRVKARKLHLHNPFEIDYFKLQRMVIILLQGEYGLTEKQAQLVDAKCFEDNHACFEDYLSRLPGYAQFAKEILEEK